MNAEHIGRALDKEMEKLGQKWKRRLKIVRVVGSAACIPRKIKREEKEEGEEEARINRRFTVMGRSRNFAQRSRGQSKWNIGLNIF